MRHLFILIVALLSTSLSGQHSDAIEFKDGFFTPEENIESYIQESQLHKRDLTNNRYYRLLQFRQIPSAKEIAQMEQAGIKLLQYVPNKTYYASIHQSYNPNDLRHLNIRYISTMSSKRKISHRIQSNDIPAWAMRGKDHIEVSIMIADDMDDKSILTSCAYDGIEILEYNGYDNFIMAEIPITDIERVSDLPYVFSLELGAGPSIPDETPGRALNRANMIDTQLPLGRNYNGEGVAVLCRDDGAVFPHVDFHGRITNLEENSGGDHGDGVSGIMSGAGNKDPRNRGMAAGSHLFVVNYNQNFTDNETMSLHFSEDVLVTNSSYSNGCNAGYTNTTRTVDSQCADNPTLMHVFSAGNSNNQECGYGAGDQWGNITGGHKQGKNVIATANTDKEGRIMDSSSRGPAEDGRIKPDLAANGNRHISTDDDHAYMSFGGTSGAAPCIAGVMAMLHQAYRENNNGETAEAALLKAIMLNTADDLGNVGPDYIYGWGTANAFRSAIAIEEKTYLKNTISQGESLQHTITVPPGTKEIRIMTYWHDRPGSSASQKALVNDIDTRVIAPDGQEHLPWILQTQAVAQVLELPAMRGEDHLNNMEQVLITDPEAGEYTVSVFGNTIPFSSAEYYTTWEIKTGEVTLVFPIGGEQLANGTNEFIYWESIPNGDPYSVDFSADGGTTWTSIGEVGPNVNVIAFPIPNLISKDVLVSITRSGETVVSEPFTITPIPRRFEILEICGNDMLFKWDPVNEATSYDVYTLGEKYMQYDTTTTLTSIRLPISNPFEENWFAVSANFDNEVKGRRSIAINNDGSGLLNCKLDYDLTMEELAAPMLENFILCSGSLEQLVSVKVINSGNFPLENIDISYQSDGGPIVTETFSGTLSPEDTLNYTFQEPVIRTGNGEFNLKTWTTHPNETLTFNDTAFVSGPLYLDSGQSLPLQESFPRSEFADFWIVDSPENDEAWTTRFSLDRNNQFGFSMSMRFDNFQSRSLIDYVQLIPVDFSDAEDDLYFSFDVAYFYDNQHDDGLRIEVSTDCGMTFTETIYEKSGADLATSSTPFNNPESSTNWAREEINISQYKGLDKVIFRFVAIDDRGTRLFVDNINIEEVTLEQPTVSIRVNGSEFCPLSPVTVSSEVSGGSLDYIWDFGNASLPATSMQSGPHEIAYFLTGEKTISLEVANSLGSATAEAEIEIIDIPSGGFSSEEVGGGTVQFNSNFNYPGVYTWTFGDGQSSNQEDPLHTYPGPGTYEVKLQVRNQCGIRILSDELTVITSDTEDLQNVLSASISPNPNQGEYVLTIETDHSTKMNMQILDISGRIVMEEKMSVASGVQKLKYDLNHFEAGIYYVKLYNESGMKTMQMFVTE